MRELAAKLLGKAGLTLGILVIAGSVLGGVALASGLGSAPADDPGSAVPLNNDSGAPTTQEGASTEPPADRTAGTSGGITNPVIPPDARQARPRPAGTPTPTLTCWDESMPSERPDGIEKCEDGD